MKLSEIRDILKARVLTGDDQLDTEITLGAASDLMSDLLIREQRAGTLVLSGLNNLQLIRTAVIAGIAAVVFVRGKVPSQDIIEYASKQGLPLLTSPFTMFTSCGRVFSHGIRGIELKKAEQPA